MKKTHQAKVRAAKYVVLCSAVVLLLTSWAANKTATSESAKAGADLKTDPQKAAGNAHAASGLQAQPTPFANTTNPIPPSSVYSGPLFQLSYKYPATPPPPPVNPPWRQALGGQPIGPGNALAYVNALKNYVAADMRQLILNYGSWDAGKAGWYNQPWLAGDREAIHGTYIGSTFNAGTLPGQSNNMTTYVLTYYDEVAGYTVGNFWGPTALTPKLTTSAAQFREGAVIVKLALVSLTGDQWPQMKDAARWQLYASTDFGGPIGENPSLIDVSLMQFDIIVKDTKTAPKTGWVFSTLVYDNTVKGDAWDRMVPLGAMWGNDPEVAANPNAPLKETVINPKAPAYSTATLGWGGRLSGPNDGAVVAPGYVNGVIATVAASSCMSCHSPAEYPLKSFILPVPTQNFSAETNPGAVPAINGALVLYEPGSPGWMGWFQDRPGTVPKDAGTIALDYDMVFAFKALPVWAQATGKKEGLVHPLFRNADALRRGLKYNGLP